MSCNKRNVYALERKGFDALGYFYGYSLSDFFLFFPTKRVAKFGWQQRIFCLRKEEKAVSPTQLKSDRL